MFTYTRAPFSITFLPVDPASAAEIICWEYPPPYDVYNLATENPRTKKAAIAYILEPSNHFYVMKRGDGRLLAFCSYGQDAQVLGGNYQEEALDIGLGVHPDFTGHGWGHWFASAALAFGCTLFPAAKARVTIAQFNVRAQKVWQKVGFEPVQQFCSLYDNRPFILMQKCLSPQLE
ncbi:MAG: hypothetical protein Kow0080_34460 [Candidatus Promineifilaceae bacterium]